MEKTYKLNEKEIEVIKESLIYKGIHQEGVIAKQYSKENAEKEICKLRDIEDVQKRFK